MSMPRQQLAIVGRIGIGPVMIGLPMADLRGILGEPTRQFRKYPGSPKLTDAYEALGVHVYYDDADCVDFVESFAVPGISICSTVSLYSIPQRQH
jgi:hypothetical protein